MSKYAKSAGILLYRRRTEIEFFLVHPGGPFWKNKDTGAWSIPKGEFTTEDPETAARREFTEETGQEITIPLRPIGTVRLKSGKHIFGFAGEGDADAENIRSNLIHVSWPPRTGKLMAVPEVDRAGWFTLEAARVKIHPVQVPFLERCLSREGYESDAG